MALESRGDLIAMIFGDGKKRRRAKKKKITAHDFKTFAAQHNQSLGGGNG